MSYCGGFTLNILLLSTLGLSSFAAALAFFLRIFKFILSLRVSRKYFFFGIRVNTVGDFFSSSLSSEKSSSNIVTSPELGLFLAVFISGEAAFGLPISVFLLRLLVNFFPGVTGG